MRALVSMAWLCAALVLSACAAPPNKEMDQAQGAIEAARAAGAERYAADEYRVATQALKNSNDAVAAGDYRLALNHALESLEQARNAAGTAANTKARLRAEVEREMADIAALLAQANTRTTAATRARVPARLLATPRQTIDASNADVQEAGEAIKADDYLTAQTALQGVKGSMEKAIAEIDAAIAARTRRR